MGSGAFNSNSEGEGIKKLSPNETIALLVHAVNSDNVRLRGLSNE
jgi:hypothetical protein